MNVTRKEEISRDLAQKSSVYAWCRPQPGWAVYLRTSSDENQKPELSRTRQRFLIDTNVLQRSEVPLIDQYVDVLTGKTPRREGYQRLLHDARSGRFSHVIVERADRFGRNDTEALRAIDELHDFGVAVRFANSPDLDPMDADDRVLVALSFTLARREFALLGIRVRGGLQAKRQSGGYVSLAPDGYRNVEGSTELSQKHDLGLVDTALSPEDRAKIQVFFDPYQEHGIVTHALQTRQAGARRFLAVHVLVPGDWKVQAGHRLVERMGSDLHAVLPRLSLTTHLEPLDDPHAQGDTHLDRDYPSAQRELC